MEDLRKKLQYELSKQDVHLDRLDREKQEESNLVAMLQVDIERLNNDRYGNQIPARVLACVVVVQ